MDVSNLYSEISNVTFTVVNKFRIVYIQFKDVEN